MGIRPNDQHIIVNNQIIEQNTWQTNYFNHERVFHYCEFDNTPKTDGFNGPFQETANGKFHRKGWMTTRITFSNKLDQELGIWKKEGKCERSVLPNDIDLSHLISSLPGPDMTFIDDLPEKRKLIQQPIAYLSKAPLRGKQHQKPTYWKHHLIRRNKSQVVKICSITAGCDTLADVRNIEPQENTDVEHYFEEFETLQVPLWIVCSSEARQAGMAAIGRPHWICNSAATWKISTGCHGAKNASWDDIPKTLHLNIVM